MPLRHERITKVVTAKQMYNYLKDIKEKPDSEMYFQPIVMVGKDEESQGGDKYYYVHKTSHSTYYWNIQAANMMKKCSFYNNMKERGAGEKNWCRTQRQMMTGIFTLVRTTRLTVFNTLSRTAIINTAVLSIGDHICFMKRLWLL